MFSPRGSTLIAKLARNVSTHFVPQHEKVTLRDVDTLQNYVDEAQHLVVLTGAGISTESGIPDYRSAHVGLYARNGYKPMTYQDFTTRHSARQRYWLRSAIFWNFMYNRQPSTGHLVLAEWESRGKLQHLITQNVDRLHHKAGTENVTELHGNLYTVRCIECHQTTTRMAFQRMLLDLNRELLSNETIVPLMNDDRNQYERARPDGDIDVDLDQLTRNFMVPSCSNCKGILKPDIVFFGDNVKVDLVKRLYKLVEDCSHFLVIGSSLQVFSSYRFAAHAHKLGKHIIVLNIGNTRADDLAGVTRLNVKIGDLLPLIHVH